MATREGMQRHLVPLRGTHAVREEHLCALLRDRVRLERFGTRARCFHRALVHVARMHDVDRILEEHLPVAAILESQRTAEAADAARRGAIDEVVKGAAQAAEE